MLPKRHLGIYTMLSNLICHLILATSLTASFDAQPVHAFADFRAISLVRTFMPGFEVQQSPSIRSAEIPTTDLAAINEIELSLFQLMGHDWNDKGHLRFVVYNPGQDNLAWSTRGGAAVHAESRHGHCAPASVLPLRI